MRQDYNLRLTNATDEEVVSALRSAFIARGGKMAKPKAAFFAGLLVGAILIAAMDYGDVWLCVGQCHALKDALEAAQ